MSKLWKMKYFKNKNGYLLCTDIPVDGGKLDEVVIINSIEQAEEIFRENNGLSAEDGVFIPSIIGGNYLWHSQ